jgi:hypothetical protein
LLSLSTARLRKVQDLSTMLPEATDYPFFLSLLFDYFRGDGNKKPLPKYFQ